ncbi:MAG: hypothetical protein COW42_05710 [Deltaproteobacteria bacterium CG17_big_fil_post_rev_8_21_14_2_50_63_7]|nr:MAG: hypothetical protein COW42_05710 [Deltaproteobacteria bacterium CG17_big_fil_post_rev_8_21_14_2_50_63_7]
MFSRSTIRKMLELSLNQGEAQRLLSQVARHKRDELSGAEVQQLLVALKARQDAERARERVQRLWEKAGLDAQESAAAPRAQRVTNGRTKADPHRSGRTRRSKEGGGPANPRATPSLAELPTTSEGGEATREQSSAAVAALEVEVRAAREAATSAPGADLGEGDLLEGKSRKRKRRAGAGEVLVMRDRRELELLGRRPSTSWTKWLGAGLGLSALVVALVLLTRPTPPPATDERPDEDVSPEEVAALPEVPVVRKAVLVASNPGQYETARLALLEWSRHGGEPPEPDAIVTLPSAEFDARRAAFVDRHAPLERLVAEGRALTTMGLLPPKLFDYAQMMRKIMLDGVEQYFDEVERVVVRRAEAVDPPLRELAYWLQYQHLEVDKVFDGETLGPQSDDRGIAAMALLQGEAFSTYLDSQFGDGFFVDSPEALRLLSELELRVRSSESLQGLPAFIQAIALFPEFEGARYVRARLTKTPDRAALFMTPPHSSQEILHPQKDFTLDPVLRISVELPMSSLKADGAPEYENVMGELGLRSWLELVGNNPAAAELASAWDGDKLWSFGFGHKALVLHVSVWDDEESAAAFEAAVLDLFTKRYGPQRNYFSAYARSGTKVGWMEGILPSGGRGVAVLEGILAGVELSPLETEAAVTP